MSADGQYVASSSINGKINVWSLNKNEGMPRIREYETKGSFGLCVDLVCLDRLFLHSLTRYLQVDRVAMAASQLQGMRMVRYMSSITTLDVSRTP
jgi:hypothetical protein